MLILIFILILVWGLGVTFCLYFYWLDLMMDVRQGIRLTPVQRVAYRLWLRVDKQLGGKGDV